MFQSMRLGSIGALMLILFLTVAPAVEGRQYTLEVGAFGDANSVNSMGFRVEIRTHIYYVNTPDADYFMVGANLNGGASIEFGYNLLSPGKYCNSGASSGFSGPCEASTTVNGSQPVWYWEYSPDSVSGLSYYGSGLLQTLQANGTWHLYSIFPDSNGGWRFEIDGQAVANAQFPPSTSRDRVFFFAGKTSTASTPGILGPVEFRNLAYLKQDGWHSVEFLYALVTCGVNNQCPSNPYGVSLISSNEIIAGTSIAQPSDGQLLSINTPGLTPEMANVLVVLAGNSYALIGVIVLIALIVVGLVVRRMRKRDN
jgi:hypothetical protein